MPGGAVSYDQTPEAIGAGPSRGLEPISGRVPPHDLDAEASVLSACMLDGDALDTALDELESAAFYSEANRLIFAAMATLRAECRPVDLTTVHHELREREHIQRVGGVRYMADISDATPAVHNIESHCRIVSEMAQRRNIIAVCQRIAAEGYGDVGDPDEWVQAVERDVFATTREATKNEPCVIGPLVITEYEALKNPELQSSEKVETGFADYDAEIGGWFRGDLVTVAARPGMGKSAFVQAAARRVAGQLSDAGERLHEVVIFSLEMPKNQVAQRLLSQESGVGLSRIRNRGRRYPFGAQDMGHLVDATLRLESLLVHVDDTPGISVSAIVSKMRRWDAKVRRNGRRIGFFAIDYLQKVTHKGKTRNRDELIGAISGALKNAAMELNVPVVMLSQLNRGLETRNDKRPLLADLRESGNIEQDSDQVIFIYRASYYDRKCDPARALAIVAKNRNGPNGVIELAWNGPTTRFDNV